MKIFTVTMKNSKGHFIRVNADEQLIWAGKGYEKFDLPECPIEKIEIKDEKAPADKPAGSGRAGRPVKSKE